MAKHYQVELHAVGEGHRDSRGVNQSEIHGVRQGVAVYCLPRQRSRFARISNVGRLIWQGIKCRPQILHFHDPELIPAALLLKFITGCKVIYDVHEDFPAAILSKFWIPSLLRKPLAAFANLVEKTSSRFFDLLIFAEASYQEKFCKVKTLKADIYNYPVQFTQNITPDNFGEVLNGKADTASLGKAEINLVYAGSLTKTRGAMTMLQGLARADFQEKTFHFWILGPIRPSILQQEMMEFIANNRRLKGNVTILGMVPLDIVYRYCRSADLGLGLLHPEPNYLHSLATKLYDYMSAGLPIIASNFPDWVNLLEETQSGLTADPTDTQAIARAIEALVRNPELRAQLGMNGRQAFATRYNWAREEEKLLEVYRQLMGE